MFCSTRCRENAFALFHRVECQIVSKLASLEGDGLLATWDPVRILLVITKQGEELDRIMNHPAYKHPLAKTFSPNLKERFNSQDLSSVLRCMRVTSCNNLDDFSFDNEFDLSKFRTVSLWLYFLKQSTFFGEQGQENQVKIQFIITTDFC